MTTATLLPLLPDIDPSRVAIALERLEDEVQGCGAVYGFLIDRAGQVIAADGPVDRHDLTALALRLVPIFLASRSLARTFREWPRATVEETGGVSIITQPLGGQWLLAMAFKGDGPAAPTAQLAARWLAQLGPLAPQGRPRRPGGGARRGERVVITRDNVDLLFKDE